MPAVVKATPSRRPVFTRRETTGQRAQRMFRAYVHTLGRTHPVRWEDASKAVRDFWMQNAAEQGE